MSEQIIEGEAGLPVFLFERTPIDEAMTSLRRQLELEWYMAARVARPRAVSLIITDIA